MSQLDYFQEPLRFVANVKIFYHKLGLRVLMRSKVKSTHNNICECLTSKEMSRVKTRIGKSNGRSFLANVAKGSEIMMQWWKVGISIRPNEHG